MKKLLIILSIVAGVIFIAGSFGGGGRTDAKLYFADSSMLRLIPSDFSVRTKNKEKAAKAVIAALEKGKENNNKILRLMPNVKKGLSVRVKGKTAYVNMSGEFVRFHSDARQHEFLTIYSIVNSLTSIDGIINVKFTIDNKIQKDFKGFCDMRETFIPDYYI